MQYFSHFNLSIRSFFIRIAVRSGERELAIVSWYTVVVAELALAFALGSWHISYMLLSAVSIVGSSVLVSWLYHHAQVTQQGLERRVCELSLLNELSELLQSCKQIDEVHEVVQLVGKTLLPGYTILITTALKGMPFEEQNAELSTRYVPLKIYEAELGVMAVSTHYDDTEIRATMVSLLAIIAEYVALAIFNIQAREQLYLQATRDGLTGVYNRRFMEEAIQREVAEMGRTGYPLSLLMVDIDYFKRINDQYGHSYGDQVLINVAQIIASKVRPFDVVCRYGGEEFLLLLPNTAPSTALARAEELRLTVSELVHSANTAEQITVSVGVTTLMQGTSSAALLKRVDQALYQAKAAGRNCVKRA
jgi:diguanylate cyclase (GGDEF)-like protein